ncbi:hypothetical protein AAMO2058_000016400 [Amorphochlora amoebiformis]
MIAIHSMGAVCVRRGTSAKDSGFVEDVKKPKPVIKPGFYCKTPDYGKRRKRKANVGLLPVWELKHDGTFIFENGLVKNGKVRGKWSLVGDTLSLSGKTYNMSAMKPWVNSGTYEKDFTVMKFIEEAGQLMAEDWLPPIFVSYLADDHDE